MNMLEIIRKATIKDIVNYVQGNLNYLKSKSKYFKLEPRIQEQALLRASLCEPCLERGHCHLCGCSTPGLFYAPKKACEDGKWVKMLDSFDWEKFKVDNNIDIEDLKKRFDLAKIEIERGYDEEILESLPEFELKQVVVQLDNYAAEKPYTEIFKEELAEKSKEEDVEGNAISSETK